MEGPECGAPYKYPHIFDHGLSVLKTEFGFEGEGG
mgnify:FL=1